MDSTRIPPEIWICIFHHATDVPGTLIPDIYANASTIGPVYNRTYRPALREALITKRALVRVCKQWWHLAIPFLYQSVYIGRAHCLSSLFSTLTLSAAGRGTMSSTRHLGEYTQRLDIAIRDHPINTNTEPGFLFAIISHMSHLAIVSFAVSTNYAGLDLADRILDALHHSAESLRVLDWSSTSLEPTAPVILDFLSKCSQLRVLHCPGLVWSKEYGNIPPTLTTLRLHTIIPANAAIATRLSRYDLDIVRPHGPTALRELILDVDRDSHRWDDLLHAYSSKLTSVHLYLTWSSIWNVEAHTEFLARTCPALRRLTITSELFSAFIRTNLVFPSITYLGLRATRIQSTKTDFVILFAFLDGLGSRVPSLRTVQLLNEQNLACLLKTHTKFAMRELQPYVEAAPFRIEDSQGVLLTDRVRGYL